MLLGHVYFADDVIVVVFFLVLYGVRLFLICLQWAQVLAVGVLGILISFGFVVVSGNFMCM